jgi:protocatechuate 3,4-dioxygenase alpha subunit
MMRPHTGSQTIGPFWHMLADPLAGDLTRFGAIGTRLDLTGRLFDGDDTPVSDACVEIWQATPSPSPVFPGWGRCATNVHGAFRFVTLAPDPGAPFLAVCVFARGLMKPLRTRVYFTDIGDRLLSSLPVARRATLLATMSPRPDDTAWRWDIRLQGDGETVFLDL